MSAALRQVPRLSNDLSVSHDGLDAALRRVPDHDRTEALEGIDYSTHLSLRIGRKDG